MTALGSLVRVHDWILNEKRQKLAALEGLAERMKDDLRRLQEDLEREQRAASGSLEGTVAFPAFVAAALERRKRLRQSIAELERAIEAAREEVHAAFQEVKKYELARDNDDKRERDRRARGEQKALDELGTSLYRRGRLARED
ncbi:MAG: flagellar export protein FliJ [Kiloniellaceae bacterium]